MRPVVGVVLKHNGTVIAEGSDEAVGGMMKRTAKAARGHHRAHHKPSSAPDARRTLTKPDANHA